MTLLAPLLKVRPRSDIALPTLLITAITVSGAHACMKESSNVYPLAARPTLF